MSVARQEGYVECPDQKNSGKRKGREAVTSQMQRKQEENASLRKGAKPHAKHRQELWVNFKSELIISLS